MKKYAPQGILLGILITLSIPSISFATGIFQLQEFNKTIKTVINQPHITTFSFLYSGDYIANFNVLGSSFPSNMRFSSIKYGASGFNSIEFSGTPNTAGKYPMTLVLTDNNGALLTQSFDFEVEASPITIQTNSLPSGIINKPYSGKIDISYIAYPKTGAGAIITFKNLPEGLSFKYATSSWLGIGFGIGTIEISGTPIKSGDFQIELSATQGGINYNDFNSLNEIQKLTTKKTYTIIINDDISLALNVASPTTSINIEAGNASIPLKKKPIQVTPEKKAGIPSNNLIKEITSTSTEILAHPAFIQQNKAIIEDEIKRPSLTSILKDIALYFIHIFY